MLNLHLRIVETSSRSLSTIFLLSSHDGPTAKFLKGSLVVLKSYGEAGGKISGIVAKVNLSGDSFIHCVKNP